jgi:hypothetical protein
MRIIIKMTTPSLHGITREWMLNISHVGMDGRRVSCGYHLVTKGLVLKGNPIDLVCK